MTTSDMTMSATSRAFLEQRAEDEQRSVGALADRVASLALALEAGPLGPGQTAELDEVLAEMAGSMAEHFAAEESILYPALQSVGGGAGDIEGLRADHRSILLTVSSVAARVSDLDQPVVRGTAARQLVMLAALLYRHSADEVAFVRATLQRDRRRRDEGPSRR